MFGRRPDGIRISSIDPIVRATPYLMPMRCDAMVFLEHKIDYEKLARYIAAKSAEGEKITFMQIIIAAYIRAVSQHPEINRFVMNKQYYSRLNCTVSLTLLKDPQDANSGETTAKVKYDLTDTIFDVRDRLNAAVEKNRRPDEDNFAVRLASFALAIPGFATVASLILRFLDRYGLVPGALLDELPFHTGMYITNNASIGLHHVWHHIYNFGSTSLFFGMGSVLKEATVEADGKTRMKRWLPVGITADERVCAGAHYAGFFADMVRGLNDPASLETPPESVRFDPKAEYHVPKPVRQ